MLSSTTSTCLFTAYFGSTYTVCFLLSVGAVVVALPVFSSTFGRQIEISSEYFPCVEVVVLGFLVAQLANTMAIKIMRTEFRGCCILVNYDAFVIQNIVFYFFILH